MTAPDVYTLADFAPDGHLRETCAPLFDGYSCLGNGKRVPEWRDCACLLYGLAAGLAERLAP